MENLFQSYLWFRQLEEKREIFLMALIKTKIETRKYYGSVEFYWRSFPSDGLQVKNCQNCPLKRPVEFFCRILHFWHLEGGGGGGPQFHIFRKKRRTDCMYKYIWSKAILERRLSLGEFFRKCMYVCLVYLSANGEGGAESGVGEDSRELFLKYNKLHIYNIYIYYMKSYTSYYMYKM